MALFWPEYALAMLDRYTTGLRVGGGMHGDNRVGWWRNPTFPIYLSKTLYAFYRLTLLLSPAWPVISY